MPQLVTSEGAAALLTYKYKGVDHGLLSNYAFQPWWNFCVTLLPMWLAPNLVTLIALLFMIVAYALSFIYMPNLTETAPSWVYVYFGVAMFAYMTLDAIDGKQARRTGSSSPLGELFDHGCDAVNTIFTVITTGAALQLGGTHIYFWFCTLIFLSFWLAQWEEYHTHIMEFPFLGVTEGHVLYMTMMFITAITGPSFWSTSFLVYDVPVTYGSAYVSLGIVGAVLGAYSSANRVIGCIVARTTTAADALSRLAPVITLHSVAIVWALARPYAQSANSPFHYPHLFELVRGFITAHSVGKTILARVTSAPFPHVTVTIVPWVPAVLLFVEGALPPALTLRVYLAFVLAFYFLFAYRMVRELCTILKIRAFHITPKN